jgi:hypothetical protein
MHHIVLCSLRRGLWADGTSSVFLGEQADLRLMVLMVLLARSALSRRSVSWMVRRAQEQGKFRCAL